MRCYNHHESEAVGTCRSCGRGVCPACAAEVEKAVACRERCESDVATLFSINRNALQYARSTKQASYLGPTVFVLIGVMLTALGARYAGMDFAMLGGGVVVAIGLAFFVIQYRMAKGLRA